MLKTLCPTGAYGIVSFVAVELRTWISREGHTDQFAQTSTASTELLRTQALSVRRIEEDDLRQPGSQTIKRAHD